MAQLVFEVSLVRRAAAGNRPSEKELFVVVAGPPLLDPARTRERCLRNARKISGHDAQLGRRVDSNIGVDGVTRKRVDSQNDVAIVELTQRSGRIAQRK